MGFIGTHPHRDAPSIEEDGVIVEDMAVEDPAHLIYKTTDGKAPLMYDDIYDATFTHQPDESDVKIDGEIQCPSCDEKLFPDMSSEVLDTAIDEPIAAPVECPECGTRLEFLIEPLPIDEIGLGITVVRE